MRGLPLTQAAVEFAWERHAGQHRLADRAPFILHPLEVASLLERSHYPDHVVAAAVLHDVLEDTDAERWELETRFGPEVSALVAVVSDDLSIPDENDRRDDVRERVRRAGDIAPVVYAADKVSKVRELRILMLTGFPRGGGRGKREHYRKSLAMSEETNPRKPSGGASALRARGLEKLPPQAIPDG